MPVTVPSNDEFSALSIKVDEILARLDGGEPTEPTPEPTDPLVPANLRMTPGAEEYTYLLEWDAVDGAESYTLYEELYNNLFPGISVNSSLRGPLGADGIYVYYVAAVVDGVTSPWSNPVTVTVAGINDGDGATEVPPQGGDAPTGNVLFSTNFESGLSSWSALQSTPTGHDSSPQPVSGRVELVPRPGGTGTACKIRRPSGDRERTELLAPGSCDVSDGNVRMISVDWLFPESFPTPNGRWFIVYQQHAGSGSPAFCIEVDGQDRLVVRNNRTNSTPTVIGPIDRGVWHRYDIVVKFASDGWVEVYRDGVQVVGRTARNTSPADYAKIGIYTDHNGDDSTAELFIDNFAFSAI